MLGAMSAFNVQTASCAQGPGPEDWDSPVQSAAALFHMIRITRGVLDCILYHNYGGASERSDCTLRAVRAVLILPDVREGKYKIQNEFSLEAAVGAMTNGDNGEWFSYPTIVLGPHTCVADNRQRMLTSLLTS